MRLLGLISQAFTTTIERMDPQEMIDNPPCATGNPCHPGKSWADREQAFGCGSSALEGSRYLRGTSSRCSNQACWIPVCLRVSLVKR